MSSLTIAVTHAIAFLTRPLVGKYNPSTIDRLHAALENQLVAAFSPSWLESDPSHGSSLRVLSLSPNHLPPSPIWRSAVASRVQWSDWIAALGDFDFDLFVDPGCVAFRIGAWAESFSGFHVVWQQQPSPQIVKPKTLAQTIHDEEEDVIFSMINNEMSSSHSWLTPILDQFPSVPIPSLISRPSSRSSSTFSYSDSGSDSASMYSTPSSCQSMELPPVASSAASSISSNSSSSAHPSRSRRSNNPRIQDVFIDGSKKEVTNYDNGKTTVLTGGVMLGAPAPRKQLAPAPVASNNINAWRRNTPRW